MSNEKQTETADDWWTEAKKAEAARDRERSQAERQHRVSYLSELHTLVGELINRSPGFEWVAVDRETFEKLRRLHGGDAP